MFARSWCLPLLPACFLLAGGCFPSSQPKDTAEESETAGDQQDSGSIIGKKTQDVMKLETALADGAVRAKTKIETNNPLMQSASAYRTSVGKLGAMSVKKAIQLRNAQSIDDPTPLSYDEFMTEIIKKGEPDGIRFAKLPYYQEYTWDVENQELVVVDFPERKKEREQNR